MLVTTDGGPGYAIRALPDLCGGIVSERLEFPSGRFLLWTSPGLTPGLFFVPRQCSGPPALPRGNVRPERESHRQIRSRLRGPVKDDHAGLSHAIQIGSSVDMAPALRDLIALALLAGLGCGLALAHGDLFFAAVFGVACAVTIIEAIRRFR